MDEMNEKHILVAGASGNLGEAVVKTFLDSGAIVFGIDRRKGRMDKFSRAVDYADQFYSMEEIDVTDVDAVMLLADNIQQNHGEIDVLVNTVGAFSTDAGVHKLDRKTFQRMMGLNVYSFLNLTKAFVPHMIKKGSGKVISIGAKAGLNGSAKMGAYAASKAALMRLTESLAAELKSDHIQVNCILPGTIDTPENRQDMPNADFSKWVPSEKLAEVILFMASSIADEITGASIPVYGGL